MFFRSCWKIGLPHLLSPAQCNALVSNNNVHFWILWSCDSVLHNLIQLRYASKKTLHTVVSRRRRKTPHYTVLSPLLNRCKTAVERPGFAQRRLALKTAVKRSLSPLSPALKRSFRLSFTLNVDVIKRRFISRDTLYWQRSL